MNKKFEHLRKNYNTRVLEESNTPEKPIELFLQWFDEVTDTGGVEEVNAMTLSTLNSDGNLQSRVVLLKGNVGDSFIFYTNYESQKCNALLAYPNVSLSFFWPNLERQVLISGIAEKTDENTSDAYFSSRPRGSQLGAHVSPQSRAIDSRAFLEDRLKSLTQKFEGKDIPRPKHWGGIAVHPKRIEFWQGRPNRLHDRIIYTKLGENTWQRQRLAP